MKTKNKRSLFALLVIVLFLSACTLTPKVSNFHMAKDDQNANQTTVFAPTDAFYLFFDVSGISKATPFDARWYALNIAGKDPNIPFKIMNQIYDGVSSKLRFQLTNTTDWPVGQYRVDVYMSGNKVGEVLFSVSQ